MPTYTANDDREAGFTLIELIVVLFIIGLAAAAVVVTAPGGQSRLRSEADALALRIAAARDQSVLQSHSIGIWLRPSGYGFERRSDGQWDALTTKPFKTVDWQPGTRIMGVDRQSRVVFDATGMPNAPTKIRLSHNDEAVTVDISASGEVNVGQ